MRPVSCFYVSVSDKFDVLIFHRYVDSSYVWEFYCSDGIFIEYQFGIPDDGQDLEEIEKLAVSNFQDNNMYMRHTCDDYL